MTFVSASVDDVSEPDNLAQTLRTSLGRAHRGLREHGGALGLTASQREALGYIHREGPLTITALARRVGVRSQSMGATVGVLLERDLVTVTPDPADGRQKVLATTSEAVRLVGESRNVRDDWLAHRLTTLTTTERQILAEASVLLDRLFDEGR